MRKNINLINTEAKKTLSFLRLKRQVKKITLVIAVLFFILALGTTTGYFFLSNKIKSGQSQITNFRAEVNRWNQKESLALTISDRINGVNLVFKERKDYSPLMADLELLMIPGFALTEINTPSPDNLKINGTCQNKEILNNLNEKVEQVINLGHFSQVSFPTVGRSEGLKYNALIEFKR